MPGSKEDGGFELWDFKDLNHTFKVKWLKECLKAPNSIWYFIPHNIIKDVGGLHFLLLCNYNVSKLPLSISKFYKQALLAWKLCYSHNFSPHKTIIWNNENITKGHKSLYLQNWVEKNIILLKDLFNNEGQLMSYEMFLQKETFPVKPKEYRSVVNSIPSGLKELMKGYYKHHETMSPQQSLYLNGIQFMSYRCTNKHIRKCLYSKRKMTPCGKTYWNSLIQNINWHKAWLVPFNFLVSNKIRELHLKLLHNIYPTKMYISRFSDTDDSCTFCKSDRESIIHLFYSCPLCITFWREVENYIFFKTTVKYHIDEKIIIIGFPSKNNKFNIVNLFILLGKFHIYKV